jgi:hypothetical protein
LVTTLGASTLYSLAVAIATIGLRDRYARITGATLLVLLLGATVAGLVGQHGWIEAALGAVTWMWCLFAVAVARR